MKEIGHYSGNRRLDVSDLEEPDQDTNDEKQKWLSGRREIRVKRKLRIWNERIAPTIDPSALIVHMVGQSHIDCAWMWRFEQTRKKAQVTFQKAIIHSKMFPNTFCFALSQPILLEWIKEDNPRLFKEIQEFVKKGNIELVGGSYVEPDCMMPSGEAMIRQRLYGMKFLWENFHQLPSVEWFLDSFGYNYGLPQILVKSGAKYFWSTKMGWNLSTTFPFVHLWWQGADGSKILAGLFHMDISVFDTWQKFQVGRHFLKDDGRKVWNYELDYSELEKHMQEKTCPHVGYFFGKSDGGHGPTHKEVAYANEIAKQPNYKWSKVKTFFTEVEKFSDQFPIWNDELYLETHRGCFSNHANVKRFNRKFENMLVSLEMLAVITSIQNSNYSYPQKSLEEMWKIVLKNQFHDVLPGSSIPEVFDDCYDDWKYLESKADQLGLEIAKALENQEFNENDGQLSFNFLLFNPHSWEGKFRVFFSSSFIKGDKKCKIAKIKCLNNGNEYYGQRIDADPQGLEDRLPSGWWSVLALPPLSITPIEFSLVENLEEEKSDLEIAKNKLSNGKLSIEINPTNGAILKLVSQEINNGINLLGGDSSNLTLGYLDNNKNDHAWNLTPEYWNFPLNFANDKDVQISISDHGPVFVTLEVKKQIDSSPVIQKIRLFKDCPEIFFEYYADWKKKDVMLKILYRTSTKAEKVVADGLYCNVTSKINPEVPCDKARYEKMCQEYVDLSTHDNSWGIALINQGKYAFDVLNGDLRLTLLRSCRYPDSAPEAWVNEERKINIEKYGHEVPEYSGLGPFNCRYALLPHNDGILNPLIKRKAREFNMPISVIPIYNNNSLEHIYNQSLMEIYPNNVFLGTIKFNEWKNDETIIVRFYEGLGIKSKVKVTFSPLLNEKILSISSVDLIERRCDFNFQLNETGILEFNINEFELCTFKIKLKN